MKMLLRRIRLVLPSSSIIELHPIILAIFDFSCVLEGLREQVSQVVVVWSVLKAEVAHISEVLCEFF
jgi:hypothetical protein